MKAIVLVGGEGTRLRPLTYHTPKPLLPIVNVPFLERQLSWLAGHGVDEVVLSLGYLPEAFERHFASGRFGAMRVRWVVEREPLGTAGGIRFAADGIDERVVVCNGDVLTDLDLTALVRFHDERAAEATIALTRVDDPSAFGVVPTRDDGEVVAFVEKPPPGKAPTNWINAGTYVLEPSVLARIPSRLTVSIERETFPRMLDMPRRLFAQHSDAYWIDIGTPRKYFEAHADVLAGRVGLPPAPGAVERAAAVWVQGRGPRPRRARARPGARRRRRVDRRGCRCRRVGARPASGRGAGRARAALRLARRRAGGARREDRRHGRRTRRPARLRLTPSGPPSVSTRPRVVPGTGRVRK